MHGELYTTKIVLDTRSYFFNVKENRTGDVFLQIVESKSRNGEDFERRDIVVFAENLQPFLRGLDEALTFINREQRTRKPAPRPRDRAVFPTSGDAPRKRFTVRRRDDDEAAGDNGEE